MTKEASPAPADMPLTPDPSPALTWNWLEWDALSTRQLYCVLRMRQLVFAVEQECCYCDTDDWDNKAVQLLTESATGEPAATCRLFGPGIRYPEASIGRVLTMPNFRGRGLGHELIQRALQQIETRWGACNVRIAAQQHLTGYYEKHGFRVCSDTYPVDQIPHVDMIRQHPVHGAKQPDG